MTYRQINSLKIIFVLLIFLTNQFSITHSNLSNRKFERKRTEENIQTYIPYTNDYLNEQIDLFNMFFETHNEKSCFYDELCAIEWLTEMNELSDKISEQGAYLDYQYQTNVNSDNEKFLQDFSIIPNKFQKIVLPIAKTFYKNSKYWSNTIQRMLYLSSKDAILWDENDVIRLANISNQLETIFATAKVCRSDIVGKCQSLEPDLVRIMANSRDYHELLWAWKGWSDATGPKMKELYIENVELINKAAQSNGYTDASEYLLDDFETENFEKIIDDLYKEVKPFYEQLHAYVRRRLREYYGEEYVPSRLIPCHLLGNIWAQNWENIYDLVIPYPQAESLNLTEKLKNLNYTPKRIFKEAENFFESIGLYPMTKYFWKYSMIEKPKDREVVCHGSAYNFNNKKDFRIKMCTTITSDAFYVVHHEMGHIEYYMSYKNQPSTFKTGANIGFHEAIGDTIALSVFTPKHLKLLNLIENDELSPEANINFLMQMALKKIGLLPFSYLVEKWRFGVFKKDITPDNYNKFWWKMRNDYQGIESPIERTENDFDPGNKFHIPSNAPYINYFVSLFHQFQFYEALCRLANHDGPLHTCDFYGSLKAGHKLREMMSLGASKHWSHALKLLTGHSKISASSLFKYFEPLIKWLEQENRKYDDEINKIGW